MIGFNKWILKLKDSKIKLKWNWMLFKAMLGNRKINVQCSSKRWTTLTGTRYLHKVLDWVASTRIDFDQAQLYQMLIERLLQLKSKPIPLLNLQVLKIILLIKLTNHGKMRWLQNHLPLPPCLPPMVMNHKKGIN